MAALGQVHFSRRQMIRFVYGAMRNEGAIAPLAAWVALKNAKPRTLTVTATTGEAHDGHVVCNVKARWG
jgi:hypothetical protein